MLHKHKGSHGDLIISLHNEVVGGGGGGKGFHTVRPSVCPSVRPASCVRSVAPGRVLVGSISHLCIVSSNIKRCVTCKVYCGILKFEFLSFVFKFIALTIS